MILNKSDCMDWARDNDYSIGDAGIAWRAFHDSEGRGPHIKELRRNDQGGAEMERHRSRCFVA